MGNAYLLHALVALVFFFLGFFVKVFFAKNDGVTPKKLDEIRKAVLEMRKESAAGHPDSPTKNAVETLEKQIRHSKEQMNRLQQLTLRFEETIDLLQREAEAIRTLILTPQRVAGPPGTAILADSTTPAPFSTPAAETHRAPATAADKDEDSNAPAWQKTLNNILGQVDKREED